MVCNYLFHFFDLYRIYCRWPPLFCNLSCTVFFCSQICCEQFITQDSNSSSPKNKKKHWEEKPPVQDDRNLVYYLTTCGWFTDCIARVIHVQICCQCKCSRLAKCVYRDLGAISALKQVRSKKLWSILELLGRSFFVENWSHFWLQFGAGRLGSRGGNPPLE
jgi:hypothetical protein